MTQENKAKAYDELFVKANRIYNNENDVLILHTIENLFPELKESEDERIRKELIAHFKTNSVSESWSGLNVKKVIAWLEKQGEQKPTDKVEPKFKNGQWIIHQGTENIYQVVAVIDNQYQLKYGDNYTIQYCEDVDRCTRLWTIQDAKDGDVLACNEEILLFKSYSVQGRISLYCWYNGQTNNFHDKEVDNTLLTTRNKICPATKEQRDTLMKAMTDAGWEFDFDKKKLKKVELQPSQWNISDFRTWQYIVSDVLTKHDGIGQYLDDGFCKRIAKYMQEEWSKKLSLGQNTAKWSEEDKAVLEVTKEDVMKYWGGYIQEDVILDWLKSLKDRTQPQPKQE